MEYVSINDGAETATMANAEYYRFVTLYKGDECPKGCYPVVKVEPKPEPGVGDELAYTYTIEGGKAVKRYFLVPKGTRFSKKLISKLKIYTELAARGMYDTLMEWLSSVETPEGVNMKIAYELANEISLDHPLFTKVFSLACARLGISEYEGYRILNDCKVQ